MGLLGVVQGFQENLTVAFFVYPLPGTEKAVGLHHIRGRHSPIMAAPPETAYAVSKVGAYPCVMGSPQRVSSRVRVRRLGPRHYAAHPAARASASTLSKRSAALEYDIAGGTQSLYPKAHKAGDERSFVGAPRT